ncbi:MAG TPA: dihydrofolate reductase [Candidatus Saccharimonadales bacterium]|nr:dihydrofolate reductase [Candidatus Saccharimonadales bacterium]
MIRLIAAVDRKLGIAKGGIQPWYIPEDEHYFTDQTKKYGGAVLVGSTTFRTFRAPLAERQNYVLTRDREPINGAEIVTDLEKFLKDFQDRDLWVVGGADVFAQVVQAGKADELYLTHIQANFGCNQFFPAYEQAFKLAEQSDLHEQNGFIFTFARYSRS